MYKAIIIDDELMARELLKGMINEFCKQIEVVDLCADLPSGIKAIHKHKPNLIFLDIEMPGYSGLDLLDFFNEDQIDFSIIFVTAYNQYAIQAFKLSAIDYLLKPIEIDDLITAVSLFEKYKKRDISFHILKDNLNSNFKKIAINTATTIQFVNLCDILFFKADGAYTHVYLKDDKSILTSKNLKHFEELLSQNQEFIRCHKSYLVNVNHIKEFVKADGGYLVVENQQVNVSTDKLNKIIDFLK